MGGMQKQHFKLNNSRITCYNKVRLCTEDAALCDQVVCNQRNQKPNVKV